MLMTRAPKPSDLGLSRRGFLTGVGGGLAAVALAGCTNSANDTPSTAPSGSAAGAFPVTVTHRFGKTTIPKQPQRIVALGQTDCDPLIALGITPIAIGSFVASWYDPVHPWNQEGLGADPKQVSFVEIEFEKIAALAPDLITMVSGGISKSDYDTLSKIAPVVGTPVGYTDSAVPYAPHTQLIGQCVGMEDQAKSIVADVDSQYAAAVAAHPEWASLTAGHAECYSGAFDVLGKNAPRTQYLLSSSFSLTPQISKITGDEYSTSLSAEELDIVGDLDMVIWCTDNLAAVPQLQKNPVVSRLANVQKGNVIWISADKTDQFMWAMDANTVLSAPYAIKKGVPMIEAALEGKAPESKDYI
jgi:iron complex transport system substrate-binding protein